MIIYLIRHGDNESLGNFLPGRKPGIHLNGSGQTQAMMIAQSLIQEGIQHIIASPLERTLETAQPLADLLRLPVEPDARLIEMDAGDLTGKPFTELKEMDIWKRIRRDPVHQGLPNGERFTDAQDRLWTGMEWIHQNYEEHAVIAVFTHADCIKMIVTRAMQMPLSFFPRLVVDPASLTILGFKKETTWLGGLNLHPPYNLPPFHPTHQKTN